jgi:hypothetical protein
MVVRLCRPRGTGCFSMKSFDKQQLGWITAKRPCFEAGNCFGFSIVIGAR